MNADKMSDLVKEECQLNKSTACVAETERAPHLHRNLIDFCEEQKELVELFLSGVENESESEKWAELSKRLVDGISNALE